MKYKPAIVLAYFREMGLPKPELEHQFHPERKWRFDFAWLETEVTPTGWRTETAVIDQKLALEVQGGAFVGGAHVRGASLRKEHEKRNAAVELGWRILYYFPEELCLKSTVDHIKRCLYL